MEYALFVLAPPANAESALGDVQTRLFREAGVTSALALPPVLPLCFLPPAEAGRIFKQVLREVGGAATGFSVISQELVAVSESLLGIKAEEKEEHRPPLVRTSLFYQVGFSGQGRQTLKAIKAAGARACASAGKTVSESTVDKPLPLCEFGFFLGQEPGAIPEQRFKEIKERLSPLPAFQFSLFTYELLKLRVADPPRPWFQEVFWEVIVQSRVRRERQV